MKRPRLQAETQIDVITLAAGVAIGVLILITLLPESWTTIILLVGSVCILGLFAFSKIVNPRPKKKRRRKRRKRKKGPQ